MNSQKKDGIRPPLFYCKDVLTANIQLLSVRYLKRLPMHESRFDDTRPIPLLTQKKASGGGQTTATGAGNPASAETGSEVIELSSSEIKVIDPASQPSDSLLRSLAEIEEIEVRRIAEEKAAEESDRKRAEQLHAIVEAQRIKNGRARVDQDTRGQSSLIRSLAEIMELEKERIAEGQPTAQSSLGLPWCEESVTYQLNDSDLAECQKAGLDERVKWMLPVPSANTNDKGEQAILRQFAGDVQICINGKKYYVFEGEGFAKAKKVTRIGRTLHIWTDAAMQYDFLGEVSSERSIAQDGKTKT